MRYRTQEGTVKAGDRVVWLTHPPGTFGQALLRLPALVLQVRKRVQIELDDTREIVWVSPNKLEQSK